MFSSLFRRPTKFGIAIVSATAISAGSSYVIYAKNIQSKKPQLNPSAVFVGTHNPSLPNYNNTQVAEHNSLDNRIWVTYKEGVYDVTEFVKVHPGGNRILLAAGKSIEPFWALYAAHNSEEVRTLLEKYRIGNLKHDPNEKVAPVSDPYAKEPPRNPALFVLADKPFNAETPPELLVDSHLTPNDWFFVRNHLPIPTDLKEANWSVVLEGEGIPQPLQLNLNDIKTKYPKHSVTTTMSCAGNRRREMQMVGEVKGLSWTGGGIGTATWTGARLSDVLDSAGFNFKSPHVQHIQFEGHDKDPLTDTVYGASIPADLALHPRSDVLLAYEMNGESIPQDHGYPVRVVVPGVAGARNVKWVKTIKPSKEESQTHWQQKDYKTFSPGQAWKEADFDKAVSIQETPVTSFICQPVDGTHVQRDDIITLRGYAISGGGKAIIRTDVSPDGGKKWIVADTLPVLDRHGKEMGRQDHNRAWAWTRWECDVPIATKEDTMPVCVKATDAANNTQPEEVGPIWNLRGLLNNSWHCIKLQVKDE